MAISMSWRWVSVGISSISSFPACCSSLCVGLSPSFVPSCSLSSASGAGGGGVAWPTFSADHFPKGFKVAGISAGLRKKKTTPDLTLIVSSSPCNAAAVFTKNRVAAAPVQVSRSILNDSNGQNISAVVINAGCANAATGDKGVVDAWKMSELASRAAGVQKSLVMSTGVIGPFLQMDKIEAGITTAASQLKEGAEGWNNASHAIMTTDTRPKLVSERFTFSDGKSFTVCGIAKGAGMIHPNMATMLSVLATDAQVPAPLLKDALNYAVNRSFNNISVDGDTSTNDTLAVLANGQSSFSLAAASSSATAFQFFQHALTRTCARLSHLIVRDGEGATKFISVTVSSASSLSSARQVATSICKSNLVKTAMFGQDANWGRIICAAGYSGADVIPEKMNLWFVSESATGEEDSEGRRPILVDKLNSGKSLHLVKDGRPHDVDEAKALELLKQPNIYIYLNLGQGNAETTMWTCDFSYDYVKINADYRS